MLKKIKKPLFLLLFSPIVICPLVVATGCSATTMKNVEVVYDKKTDVSGFFSEYDSIDSALTPDGSFLTQYDTYFDENNGYEISINNKAAIVNLMEGIDQNLNYRIAGKLPFVGQEFQDSIENVYVCPCEIAKTNPGTERYWYIYVSFKDKGTLFSSHDRFIIDWTCTTQASGNKGYAIEAHSKGDTHPLNSGSSNRYTMNLEQVTNKYSLEDSIAIIPYCNAEIINDGQEDIKVSGDGSQDISAYNVGSKIWVTDDGGIKREVTSALSSVFTQTANTTTYGYSLTVADFTQEEIENKVKTSIPSWTLNNKTNVIEYDVVITNGGLVASQLTLYFTLSGSNNRDVTSFNVWNVEPTTSKNFKNRDRTLINQDFNNGQKANDKTMLDYFSHNIEGNFLIRNMLNQLMDSGRDRDEFNRVRVSCDKIEMKNDGKTSQGFYKHTFSIKNLKLQICEWDPTTGHEGYSLTYVINTTKNVGVCASSMIQSEALPRRLETWTSNFMDTDSNYYLPVLYYGKLTNGSVDTLHLPVESDLFKITIDTDAGGSFNEVKLSSNTLWAVIQSFSCFRPATSCTSSVNYCFPITGFPQLV